MWSLLPFTACRAAATVHTHINNLTYPTKKFSNINQQWPHAELTDFAAGASSPHCQAAYPPKDPNWRGSPHVAESQGAGFKDAAQLHAPLGASNEHQPATGDSHSGMTDHMCITHCCEQYLGWAWTPPAPLLAPFPFAPKNQIVLVCCTLSAQQLCFRQPHSL